MFDDNVYARHHRGSSPPIHNSERSLEDWMRSCRSVDQHPYNLSDIETLKQGSVPMIDFTANKSSANDLSDAEGPGKDKG